MSEKVKSVAAGEGSFYEENGVRLWFDEDGTYKKPKRILTAYNLFFKEERRKLLSDISTKIGFSNMGRTIAAKWKMIGTEDHKYFLSLAAQDKVRFNREMALWRKLQKKTKTGAKKKTKSPSSKSTRPEADELSIAKQKSDFSIAQNNSAKQTPEDSYNVSPVASPPYTESYISLQTPLTRSENATCANSVLPTSIPFIPLSLFGPSAGSMGEHTRQNYLMPTALQSNTNESGQLSPYEKRCQLAAMIGRAMELANSIQDEEDEVTPHQKFQPCQESFSLQSPSSEDDIISAEDLAMVDTSVNPSWSTQNDSFFDLSNGF